MQNKINCQGLRITLSSIFMGGVVFLPSGGSTWFNGLPWANAVETVTVIYFPWGRFL